MVKPEEDVVKLSHVSSNHAKSFEEVTEVIPEVDDDDQVSFEKKTYDMKVEISSQKTQQRSITSERNGFTATIEEPNYTGVVHNVELAPPVPQDPLCQDFEVEVAEMQVHNSEPTLEELIEQKRALHLKMGDSDFVLPVQALNS